MRLNGKKIKKRSHHRDQFLLIVKRRNHLLQSLVQHLLRLLLEKTRRNTLPAVDQNLSLKKLRVKTEIEKEIRNLVATQDLPVPLNLEGTQDLHQGIRKKERKVGIKIRRRKNTDEKKIEIKIKRGKKEIRKRKKNELRRSKNGN